MTALDRAGRELEAYLADEVPDELALVTPRWLFVYGTLMAGEGLHEHLGPHLEAARDDLGAGRASVAGRLHDFDAWPGLVPHPGGSARVLGELYPLDEQDGPVLLSSLDEVEDFFGYGRSGSSFRRVPIEASDGRGAPALAWTYRVIDARGAPTIASGDWRLR